MGMSLSCAALGVAERRPRVVVVDAAHGPERLQGAREVLVAVLRPLPDQQVRRLRGLLDVRLGRAWAAKGCEIPNFKGSYLGRFPLVSADFWTSDHLSERSRSVGAVSETRARGTLMLKRR